MLVDKIITVCLNPSLDQTIWVDRFDLDEPVVSVDEKVYAGGKGINVSRVLTALNVPNHSVTVVGALNVAVLTDLLKAEGVSFTPIKAPGHIRENLSIVLPDGRLFKINRKGFSVDEETLFEVSEGINAALANATHPIVVFAGSLPQNMTVKQYKALIMQVRAKGIEVCVDTDIFSEQDIKDIMPLIIKPNHIELSHIAGRKLTGIDEMKIYAQTLTPYVKHILVSMGKDGLIYLSSEEEHLFASPSVEVKSTVGAGDTTLSGFIAALCDEKTIAECVRFAGVCGTASVTLPGTAIISASDIASVTKLL